MYKKHIIIVITLFSSSILFCQTNKDCNKIKTGIFYFYSNSSNENLVIKRTDSIQKEVRLSNYDTSLWKIIWQNDCSFYLKFISKTQPMSEEEKSFYNSHLTAIKVTGIYKDYYTFSGGLDSLKGFGNIKDTVWFQKKRMTNSK